MPEELKRRLKKEKREIIVKDYVAGMTDGYAIQLYNKLTE